MRQTRPQLISLILSGKAVLSAVLLSAVVLSAVVLGFSLSGKAQAANLVPTVSSGEIVRLQGLDFGGIPARDVDVWLPPSYKNEPKQKFDVLYVHDGQMQFDANINWNKQAWELDDTAARLMAEGKVRPFIVVAIHNLPEHRHSEYFPQKPFGLLKKDVQASLLKTERGPGATLFSASPYSDLYLDFIVHKLKPYVDQHFRVNTTVDHTFIMGSSMGGLISLYAALEYPGTFGAAACLSTHWPGVFDSENNPVPAAFADYMASKLSASTTTRLYFDHGDATLDAWYPPLQAKIDTLMRERGYPESRWQSRFFPKAAHTEAAWAERVDIPLMFLLGKK